MRGTNLLPLLDKHLGACPGHRRHNRVQNRPAPCARIVQWSNPLARERPRFRSSQSPILYEGGWDQGRKSGRYKASSDYDTSLNLSDQGPAMKGKRGNARRV